MKKKIVMLALFSLFIVSGVFAQQVWIREPLIHEGNVTSAQFGELMNSFLNVMPSNMSRASLLPDTMWNIIWREFGDFSNVRIGDQFTIAFQRGVFQYLVILRVTSVSGGRTQDVEWFAIRQ